jgi:hypothetical protein
MGAAGQLLGALWWSVCSSMCGVATEVIKPSLLASCAVCVLGSSLGVLCWSQDGLAFTRTNACFVGLPLEAESRCLCLCGCVLHGKLDRFCR